MTQLLAVLLVPLFTISGTWHSLGSLTAADPALAQHRLAWAGCAGLAALLGGIALAAVLAVADFAGAPAPLWLALLLGTGCGVLGYVHVRRMLRSSRKARHGYERIFYYLLWLCAAAAILVTVGIVFSVLGEAVRFFTLISPLEFLFGLEWSPQIAIREDQAGSSGKFGFVPLLAGTMLIAAIAMLVAVPLGLLSAVYQAEFAPAGVRARVKPVLEFLAGIPTVVYGFFAVVTLGPMLRDLGTGLGLTISSESALAAGCVIGVMTIPFVASLSEDALHAIPQDLRNNSLSLGATLGETALRVSIPAALPGIFAGFLLAFSRAVGETMIVVMAAGLAANMTANPLESVTTITTQIVTLLIGDQEFDDPKTLAAFALGLTLFAFTLLLNVLALHAVRKYHERYD